MMKIRKQYLRCVYFTGKLHETKLRLILDNLKFHFQKMTYHLNKLYLKIVMILLEQNIIFTSKHIASLFNIIYCRIENMICSFASVSVIKWLISKMKFGFVFLKLSFPLLRFSGVIVFLHIFIDGNTSNNVFVKAIVESLQRPFNFIRH